MKNLFEKYLKENCNKAELQQYVSFMNDDEKADELNVYMQEKWDAEPLKRKSNVEKDRFDLTLHRIHHSINVGEKSTTVLMNIYNTYSKIAAIIVLPLLLAFVAYTIISYTSESDLMTTISVPYGVQTQVDLPDGSKVWLNSGSSLKFPVSFKGLRKRNVQLDGEGFFEVASNKMKPFVVAAKGVDVEVLGTVFNMQAYKNDPELTVALVEGSVQLLKNSTGANEESIKLSPKQVAKYTQNSKRLKVKSEQELYHHFAWKDGKMVFQNEPFDSVLRQMGRKYNVDYIIEDRVILDYGITASFMHESFEEFLKIIALSSSIEYEIKNGKEKEDGTHEKRMVIIKKKQKKYTQ